MRATKRDPERVLRWGFAASLTATFALAVAHVAVEAGYPLDNFKAVRPWIVLRSEVATAESVALLAAFAFLAATWYRRGRARQAFPISASSAGLACILAGVVLGAAGHVGFSYLLDQGQFTIPSDPERLALNALILLSLPLVALGIGLMTFARASRLPPPPPEGAAVPDGRNP